MTHSTDSRPTVYVETYGCAFNVSDGEVMAGLLERDGYSIVDSPDAADAVVVNSCTVKDRSYLDFCKRVKALDGTAGPAVILAGCIPRVYQHSQEFARFSQVGPDNLAAIGEVVSRTVAGECVVRTGRESQPRLNLPKRRRNNAVEIIPISKGCLGSCTFCQTVIARGRLHSFPEEEILAQLQSAVDDGVRQIWLTSQDCGAYGLDCGTNLPRLMRRIAAIQGDFKVRVGMANPDLIKLFLRQFVEALSHEKFYQFAHVPVQAGSDKVLSDMRRLYAADDFRGIVETLRSRMPQITIATDVIVGFPTETEEDFAQTMALMRETRVPVINRSRFSPRPGTKAARLKTLPSAVVSRRSRELYQLAQEINQAEGEQWVGWEGDVLVEEQIRQGVALARNFAYFPVVLKGAYAAGQRLRAAVTAHEGFHLNATPVEMMDCAHST